MSDLADTIRQLDGEATHEPWEAFIVDSNGNIAVRWEGCEIARFDWLDDGSHAADARLVTYLRNHAAEIADALEAVARVRELHIKVTRWGDDDGEYSLDHDEYDDSPEDYTHLKAFNVCAECFRIEQSPELHDDEMPHAILEGLWPCPTIRALDGE